MDEWIGYSFICNACANTQSDKCDTCVGHGCYWDPIDKEFYEKDPVGYIKQLILASQ